MKIITAKPQPLSQRGFGVAFVLFIILCTLCTASFLLLSTVTENKQASLHSKNISSYYLAESGAFIAHQAFQKYIQYINEEVSENYSWANIGLARSFADLLKEGPLGKPAQDKKIIFHLQLNSDNDYYLTYSPVAIINRLGLSSTIQANITLVPLGAPLYDFYEGVECLTFPFNFTITSVGRNIGILPGRSTVTGEGTAFIRFCPGSYSRFALFTDIHRLPPPKNYLVWFNEFTTFAGPVYTNDTFYFDKTPIFYDRVFSKSTSAVFYNNNPNNNRRLNADKNPPYDIPIFHMGFKRGAAGEVMPSQLGDLRAEVLREDLGSPPQNTDFYLALTKNNQLAGGLYFPKATTIELIAQGTKQIIRTSIKKTYPSTDTLLDFILDYSNGTTSIVDRRNQSSLQTFNSLPNGTIFVDGNIPALSGTVQKDARLTIGAKDNITITNHILYEEDPRLNPEAQNILGILSETGNVLIPNDGAPDNIIINGTIMAPQGAFQIEDVDTVKGDKGQLTLFGGVITKYYGALAMVNANRTRDGYGRLLIYDVRMGDMRKMPLGFPKTRSLQYSTLAEDGTDTLELTVWKKSR